MRNIKLVLEYDGTDFWGWQVQKKGRTVQGVLNEAVEQLLQHQVAIYGSGRTDSGVHALRQVANFKTENPLCENSIRKGLNSYLPADVRVRSANAVEPSFHARFDAKSREYRYVISKRQSAIGRQYAWFCNYKLDVALIREASAFLVGKHVFKAFSKLIDKEEHYLSCVERIDWEEDENFIIMEICASRFLHNMIRIIVGTMVDVGCGKLSPDAVKEILHKKSRSLAGCTTPAHGLFLLRVNY